MARWEGRLFVDELRLDYGIAVLLGGVGSGLDQNAWQSYEKHKGSAINRSHNPSVGELNRKAISVEEAVDEEADGVEYKQHPKRFQACHDAMLSRTLSRWIFVTGLVLHPTRDIVSQRFLGAGDVIS